MPQNRKHTSQVREELNLGTCLPRLGSGKGGGLLNLVGHFAENIRLFNEESGWRTCTSEPENGDNSVRDHFLHDMVPWSLRGGAGAHNGTERSRLMMYQESIRHRVASGDGFCVRIYVMRAHFVKRSDLRGTEMGNFIEMWWTLNVSVSVCVWDCLHSELENWENDPVYLMESHVL